MIVSLTIFMMQYKKWLDAGAPDGEPFSRRQGLCVQLEEWMKNVGLTIVQREKVFHELQGMFVKFDSRNDLHECFPFNRIAGSYMEESENKTAHLNPERVRFVNWMLSKGK